MNKMNNNNVCLTKIKLDFIHEGITFGENEDTKYRYKFL